MRRSRLRFLSIPVIAIVVALMVPEVAFADEVSSAQAKIKQIDPGIETHFGGMPYDREPCGFTTFRVEVAEGVFVDMDIANPGMFFDGVRFDGKVKKVKTEYKELKKVLKGSKLTVTYGGFICFIAEADEEGDVPFVGVVDGTATLVKKGKKGGTLDIGVGAPLSGMVNEDTLALSAVWQDLATGDIGVWFVTGATGRYADTFIPGVSMGGLTAEAARKSGSKLEKGTATFFLP